MRPKAARRLEGTYVMGSGSGGNVLMSACSLEPGESTEAAAVRELLEEAGITGKVIRDLGTWHSASTGHL